MTFFLHDKVGREECPYLERWILDFKIFSIRLHHWMGSDDQRHFHDHPWWYVSWIIKGHYLDRSPEWDHHRKRWSLAAYSALHRHSVIISDPCWSLLLTGAERRIWGFWVNGRFRKRNKYFYLFGHHPCQNPAETRSVYRRNKYL